MKKQLIDIEIKKEWKRPEIIELDINLDTAWDGKKDEGSPDGSLFGRS